MPESLEDQLRRATRNFTAQLPEDQVLSVGRDLARELARAHAESPPRHPDLELAAIPMADGKPRLDGGTAAGDTGEDLFRLGSLLCSLATGAPADPSWRLDGPPPPELSTLARRDALRTLASPRRDVRFATAEAAAQALDAVLAPASEAPAPWPLFRKEPARTGAAPAISASGFKTLWDAPIGGVTGSPALASGLVLVPTTDGRLVFLDRSSGRVVHEMRLASAIESSPAVEGRTAFLGTDDGELIAVDVVLGREIFRVRLGQLVRSSPLPLPGRVLVGVVEAAKGAGALVALDPEKGRILWKAKLGPVFSSPTLASGRILAGSDDGALRAHDAEKGTQAWSHALGAKVRATPAIAGDVAVVGDFAGRLAGVRVGDGSRAWTLDVGHPVYSSLCASGGIGVVGCNEGHVHGVDLATGAARFEVPTRGPVVSSAAAAGDRFVIGSTDGQLYLLDGAGRVLESVSLAKDGIQSSPALDGDLVVVGSSSGVHALRLKA